MYDPIYATFKDYPTETSKLASLLRQQYPSCRSVLDVACGTGEHIRLLVREHGFRVDGVDLDPRVLAIAARKSPTSRFWEADMTDFQLPTRYDAVVCLCGRSAAYPLSVRPPLSPFSAIYTGTNPTLWL